MTGRDERGQQVTGYLTSAGLTDAALAELGDRIRPCDPTNDCVRKVPAQLGCAAQKILEAVVFERSEWEQCFRAIDPFGVFLALIEWVKMAHQASIRPLVELCSPHGTCGLSCSRARSGFATWMAGIAYHLGSPARDGRMLTVGATRENGEPKLSLWMVPTDRDGKPSGEGVCVLTLSVTHILAIGSKIQLTSGIFARRVAELCLLFCGWCLGKNEAFLSILQQPAEESAAIRMFGHPDRPVSTHGDAAMNHFLAEAAPMMGLKGIGFFGTVADWGALYNAIHAAF